MSSRLDEAASSSSSSSSSDDSESYSLRKDFNPYLAYVSAGFFFFVVLNGFVRRFLVLLPESAGRQQRWKWCNILVSFVHSTMTGLSAPLVFYLEPTMQEDMINGYSNFSHMLIGFSIGYFLYDIVDMALYNPKRSTYELLFHHFCVVTCFGISVHSRRFLPYACIALMIEINSIFLHLRQLLIIRGMPKQRLCYRNVALLNVATFVLFRILLLGWMTRWITINRDRVPLVFFTVGSIGLFVVQVMNAILFNKVLQSDFFQPSNSSSAGSGGHGGKLKCESNILNDGGFHPVSKDVNRIMKNFFDGDDNAPTTVADNRAKAE